MPTFVGTHLDVENQEMYNNEKIWTWITRI